MDRDVEGPRYQIWQALRVKGRLMPPLLFGQLAVFCPRLHFGKRQASSRFEIARWTRPQTPGSYEGRRACPEARLKAEVLNREFKDQIAKEAAELKKGKE